MLQSSHEELYRIEEDLEDFWRGYESEKIIPIPAEFIAKWRCNIRIVLQKDLVVKETKNV